MTQKPSQAEFFKLTEWTVEKGLDCLKRIVHEDMVPQLSDEEKNKFRDPEVFGNEKMKKFLEFIHQKSDGKLEMFGSVSEILDDMCHIARMLLEAIKFSDAITEISEDLVKTSDVGIIVDNNGKEFYAKCDLCFLFVQLKRKYRMTSLCEAFFESWFLDFFNQRFNDFKGCFELVPTSVWDHFVDAFEEALDEKNKELKSKIPILEEDFVKLRIYFKEDNLKYYDCFLAKFYNMTQEKPLKQDYVFYIHSYRQIMTFTKSFQAAYERNIELFIPFSKCSPSSDLSEYQIPVVRHFENNDSQFLLSKEVDIALRLAFKRRYPDKVYREDFIHVESEEEKKLGILYSIHKDAFTMMLNIFNLPKDSISKDNLPQIWKWIESLENLFMVEKTLYLIETKKINELIKRAREELLVYLTEPIYEVPIKRSYTKEESFNEVKKLMGYFNMNSQLFETLYGHVTTDSNGKPLTVKYIYEIYYQFMRYELQQVNKKLEQFLVNQLGFNGFEVVDSSSFKNTVIPPMKNETVKTSSSPKVESKKDEKFQFSGMKKGFLNGKSTTVVRKESEKEKVDGQKMSNSESEIEKKNKEIEELKKQLAESVEKSRNEENQQIKVFRNELEESRKANSLIEESNKLKAEQIKNYQEEVEKLNMNAENREVELKRIIEETARYQEEIGNLTKNLENRENELKRRQDVIDSTRNEVVKLTENLEKMKVFFETSKDAETKLKKQNEEMKTKVQVLEKQASENIELKSALNENARKNEEFEKWLTIGFEKFLTVQKSKEGETCSGVQERLEKYQKILCIDYNDFLDEWSSNLHRLSRYHPNSAEILFAKSQVANFDENYEDYIKNIRSEIRKIRENPNISINELEDEIEEFPNQEFMKKYNKWVKDNNLE